MPALPFEDARSLVLREVLAGRVLPPIHSVSLDEALGRVLAQDAIADRNYPPFDRAMRDGFAVRHRDIPGTLQITGEVRAGEHSVREVGPGQAVEIMTGAPVPQGADAVVMIEHCTVGNDRTVGTEQALPAGTNISPAGSEARGGEAPIRRGTRIDHTVIAWLAAIGASQVSVYRQLQVAIIATRRRTGGGGPTTPPAPDPQLQRPFPCGTGNQGRRSARGSSGRPRQPEHTRSQIQAGLPCDLLLLSGGVSAGRYDVVEQVLAELGAVFFFDRVLIQPGAPLVFGALRTNTASKYFFGLPGNPGSTMATFELFARAAIDLLSGMEESHLPFGLARLAQPFQHKGGLTRFLPATVRDGTVVPLASKGSGDVPALARANAFLVASPSQTHYAAGDLIPVLFR